jgi:gluconolactonase
MENTMHMKRYAIALLLAAGVASAQTPAEHPVVVSDPSFTELISPDAKLEVAARGFGFTEGNTWVQHGREGYLLFVDIPMNTINKLTPDGKVTVFLDRAGWEKPINGYDMMHVGAIKNNSKPRTDPEFREFINIGADGLTLDREGRLLICTYTGRSIVRLEKDGKRTVLADTFEGKRFNGTNDVVVAHNGDIFFTDTWGGLRDGEKDADIGFPSSGVFLIRNGKISFVVKDMPAVNGLSLSPDDKTLYVNSGRFNTVRAYDIQPDGSTTNGRQLFDQSYDKAFGYTDGQRTDAVGNIWATGPGGIWVWSPQGKHLGTILVPEKASNLTFGDPDFKTLYIDGTTSIYKIRLLKAGPVCNGCTTK